MPGLQVTDDRLWVYAAPNIGIGLMNTFVRPLVLFVTARFMIPTLGLFTLVINAFLLWLLGLLFPAALEVNGILPALLGALVLSLKSAHSWKQSWGSRSRLW